MDDFYLLAVEALRSINNRLARIECVLGTFAETMEQKRLIAEIADEIPALVYGSEEDTDEHRD